MTLAHTNQNGGAVAPRRDEQLAVPQAAPGQNAAADLMQWAQVAEAAHRIASMICSTSFVPAAYRGKPDEAAAAMLAGGELGFSPMTSLRTFDHIQGVTAPKAITQRAVAQSRGHEMWMTESTDERCVMKGRRKGSSEVVESEWTIARAEKLGLTKKQQWAQQPKAMLIARATSECARLVASDALLGIPYSTEELRDDPNLTERHPDEQNALPSPRSAARGATRTSAADLTGEKPVEQAPPAPARPKASLADVKAAFDAAGVTDRTQVTQVISTLLDRQVTDLRTLTAGDLTDIVEQATELGAPGIAALVPHDAEIDEPADEALFDGGDQ